MEPSALRVPTDKALASLSAYLKQLREQLLERGQDKDFFETQVGDRFHCLTFPNALILAALAKDPGCFTLRARLCSRLVQELGEQGTANYRMRSVAGSSLSPYPDDLDDTFCVLSAIFLHDPARLDGQRLAQATLALTATEVEPGGPYRTWLVHPEAATIWRDIDPVVNANIAYFLGLNNIRLPQLDAYLVNQAPLPASPYYPSPLHVLYFLARGLEHTTQVRALENILLACQPTNILERALLVSSLIRCGAAAQALGHVPQLLQELEEGHGFDPLPICVDTVSEGEKHFAACRELTAAFVIEALGLAETVSRQADAREAQLDPSLSVIAAAKVLLSVEDPVLQLLIDSFLTKLTSLNQARELTTLPLDFAQAWNSKTQALPAGILQKLSLAHLLGWVAYTLYDDAIDNDGTPALLSVANMAARQMYGLFADLGLDREYQIFWQTTLDGMDAANAWELLHARLPLENLPNYQDPKRLYGRSAGIMLAPIAILRLAGYGQQAPEVAAIQTFFTHYLAAKQLNDDAHDWQDDLARGHVSTVVAKVLAAHGRAYDPAHTTELQSLFWNHVILEVCAEIASHIAIARTSFNHFGPAVDMNFFTRLLDPLEASAEQALREREQSLAFLKTFSNLG